MGPAANPLSDLVMQIAQARDRAAFGDFFRTMAPRLAGYFRRAGARPEAIDELIQEVMLRVWRSAGHYDPARGAVESWVFRIARNVRVDMVSREHRPELDPEDPALVPVAPVAPDAAVQRHQQQSRLHRALETLPAEQASALRSVYFGFKTMQAAADEHGVAVGTLKSRVRLGFAHLRAALQEGGA